MDTLSVYVDVNIRFLFINLLSYLTYTPRPPGK